VQVLQRQLKVLSEQNKNLLKQLRQSQNISLEKSNQNVCNFNIILKNFA